ncbi:MAG: nucleotidyltransferase family protein [Anaerolineales bacterium]|nr:nucleotidyltransferase family protein [Anaerolineales bacterium]
METIIGAGGIAKTGDPLLGKMRPGEPKALMPIAGKPMVQWVLDAVGATDSISNVVIIGLSPDQGLDCGDKPVHYLHNAGNIFDNAIAGCKAVLKLNPRSTRTLWVSADLPLLTPTMLNWFINQTGQSKHDLYYQIIERNAMESRFPDCKRTYTHLKGGTVCGGDVSAINPNVASDAHPAFSRISAARKSVAKQAALIGPWPLLLLLTRQLSTETAAKIVHRRLGLNGVFVNTPFPEMGMDVDKPQQYEIAQRELEQRSN